MTTRDRPRDTNDEWGSLLEEALSIIKDLLHATYEYQWPDGTLDQVKELERKLNGQ